MITEARMEFGGWKRRLAQGVVLAGLGASVLSGCKGDQPAAPGEQTTAATVDTTAKRERLPHEADAEQAHKLFVDKIAPLTKLAPPHASHEDAVANGLEYNGKNGHDAFWSKTVPGTNGETVDLGWAQNTDAGDGEVGMVYAEVYRVEPDGSRKGRGRVEVSTWQYKAGIPDTCGGSESGAPVTCPPDMVIERFDVVGAWEGAYFSTTDAGSPVPAPEAAAKGLGIMQNILDQVGNL